MDKIKTTTRNQQRVLDFIRAYIRLYGVPPTYEVTAQGLGMQSRGNICRIVKELEAKGHLVTRKHKYMSIKIKDRSVDEVCKL